MATITEWTARRKPQWDDLSAILLRAGSIGIRRLPRADLKKLGPLYRRAAADLAYARLRGADAGLVHYLNDLVTRAHGLLYSERGPGAERLWRFLANGFPRLIRAYRAYILAATALFLLGGVFASVLVGSNPGTLRLVVPAQFADNDDYYTERVKNPSRDFAAENDQAIFAAGLMQNNIRVAILAFAVGMLGGIPTLLLLFYNGMPLGGLAMQQHQAGRDLLFWSLILPHGIIEITAIMIAGAAGMALGRAIFAPGELSRRDAITLAGRDSVRLVLGTVPLFIAAGLIESFVTPTNLPPFAKLVFAAFTAIGLWAYFRR